MIYTIDILNYIKDVANALPDVNQVCIGDIFELNAKMDKLYPLINIDIDNINVGKTSSEYNVQILVIDKFDEKTLYYSLSHTQNILISLITAIRKDLNELINVNYPVMLNDVRDSFQDDRVAGWLATISLNIPFSIDTCIKGKTLKERVEDYAKVIKRYSAIDLWLRADYGVVTDSNNKVSRWEDFVHPDYNIIQNTADRRPLLVDNYANTFPALQFDGVDDYLNGGDICDLKLTGGTLITVLQHEYLTNVSHSAISKANNYNADKSWYIRITFGSYRISFAVVKGREITYSTSGNYQTSDHKLENVVTAWKIDNANNVIKKYQNGINTDTDAFDGTYDMNNNYDLVIGAMGGTGLDKPWFWEGHIMEIIKFDRVLSDSEFAYVHEYLNLKYNLY